MKIKGRIVVITGAAGGIGAELVLAFCQRGARVEAVDINAKGLGRLHQQMEKKGFQIHTHRVDVGSSQALQRFSKSLKKTFPEIWINNAGIAITKPFTKIAEDDFEKILRVNLNGVINGTRMALEIMQPRQVGLIVNLASLAGHIPSPFLSAYATSKHGVVGFTRSLQWELRLMASPVKLCLVSPGFVGTAMISADPDFQIPSWLSWLVSTPASVAQAILKAVEKDREEVFPTLSGSMMRLMHRYAPSALRLSSRLMSARNFREMIGFEGIRR